MPVGGRDEFLQEGVGLSEGICHNWGLGDYMGQWFDKYIAQSSKSQMYALAIAFAILILAG